MWETVPWEEFGIPKLDLGFEDHRPQALCKGRLPWSYCKKCGLVRLKNEPSIKAWKLGCNWDDILKSRGILQ
jgi:hypothetical protein